MAYKDPPKHTQWKPGQSGNPTGKRKRPDIEALNDLITSKGLTEAIAATIIRQALGDPKKGIKPDFAYMKLLIEYRNGNAPKVDDDESDGTTDAKPRIVIPGSTGAESRPKAAGSPRKRKPAP